MYLNPTVLYDAIWRMSTTFVVVTSSIFLVFYFSLNVEAHRPPAAIFNVEVFTW